MKNRSLAASSSKSALAKVIAASRKRYINTQEFYSRLRAGISIEEYRKLKCFRMGTSISVGERLDYFDSTGLLTFSENRVRLAP